MVVAENGVPLNKIREPQNILKVCEEPHLSPRVDASDCRYLAMPKEHPSWNTISISGYHIRKQALPPFRVGLYPSNAIAYVEAALAAGLDVDQFAPRLILNAHVNGKMPNSGRPADWAAS